MSAPDPPPPTPAPPMTPPPMQKVGKIKNVKTAMKKKTARRGGQRSLVINRTSPATGSQGSGAKPY